MQTLPEQDMLRDLGIHRVIEPQGVLPLSFIPVERA